MSADAAIVLGSRFTTLVGHGDFVTAPVDVSVSPRPPSADRHGRAAGG